LGWALALGLFLAAVPARAQTVTVLTPESTPAIWTSSSGTTFINKGIAQVSSSGEEVMYFRQPAKNANPEKPPGIGPITVSPATVAAPRPQTAPLPPRTTFTQLAQAQGGDRTREGTGDGSLISDIPLEPPGPERLFQLESEKSLMERMRQKALDKGPDQRIIFPKEEPLSRGVYPGRYFPMAVEVVEPHYLCYKRLLFEDLNSERYGWDLGIIQPVVSLGLFYKDLVLLPYHSFTRPCECYECSAGYCLPGDPVPYLCYPPEISVTGAVAEAAVVAALFAVFP
jgi:hypothetical protein